MLECLNDNISALVHAAFRRRKKSMESFASITLSSGFHHAKVMHCDHLGSGNGCR